MGRIDGILREHEKIVHRTGTHWVVMGFPAMLVFLSGISIRTKGSSAVILLLIAVAWGILSYAVLRSNEFAVTSSRLLIWTIFPWRRLRSVEFTDIVRTGLYQPTLGKLLDFGRITIALSGGKSVSYRLVNSPHALLMRLEELAESARQTQQSLHQNNV